MLTDPLMELGEPDGIWIASANLLGLEGPIDAEPYERVEQGLHPETAQPLVLNAGKEGRVTYFDIVFSAPKYVSMLWARANASERELIERAHETAARDAIDCLETNFAWSPTAARTKLNSPIWERRAPP